MMSPTSNEDHVDEEDEEDEEAMSIISDAAVAVPKRQRLPVTRKLSFGSQASRAAAAALASVDDNDDDVEALLPKEPKQKARRVASGGAAVAHVPRRNIVRGTKTLDETEAEQAALQQRTPYSERPSEKKKKKKKPQAEEESLVKNQAQVETNDSSDDGSDSNSVGSDVAVTAPSKKKRLPTGEVIPSKPRDVEQGFRRQVSKKESFDSAGSADGLLFHNKKDQQAQGPPLMNPKKLSSFDSVSRHTETTRTLRSSFGESDSDDVRSFRSGYSRKTTTTNRSHKTLAEIRREKAALDMSNHSNEVPKTGCLGLSRNTWLIIIVTTIVGFSAGFMFPIWQKQKDVAHQDESVADTETNVPATLKPFDPSILYWGGSDEQDEENYGNYSYPSPMDYPTAEPEEIIPIPSIDVLHLFANQSIPLPSLESAQHMVTFDQEHLVRTAQLFVQGMIHKNVKKPMLRVEKILQPEKDEGEDYVVPHGDTPLLAFDGEVPYPTTPRGDSNDKYPQGDVQEWEGRLKHYGIHESDDTTQLDVTNGILYVARGNHITVVDTDVGTVRATISLPSSPSNKKGGAQLLRDEWLIPAESDENPRWKPAPPSPFIEKLLLTSSLDHLVVMVSNYTSIHQARVKPLLQESLVTQVFTYELVHRGNVTEWTLVDEEPHVVHGRVLYAAQVNLNQHIHIVTSSAVDTSRLLEEPLERMYYPNRNDKVYVDEAVAAANDKYIPLFVERLQKELVGMNGPVHFSLTPMAHWVTGRAESEEEQQLEETIMAQHHLQEVIVITSLSIVQSNSGAASAIMRSASIRQEKAAGSTAQKSTSVVQTAFLGPSGVDVVGSTDTHLTLTVPGFKWTGDRVFQEATHMLQWELGTISRPGSSQLAGTRFQGLGTVLGRLVQSARQSCERRGTELRMATVLASQWQVGVNGKNETIVEERSVRKSYLHVMDAQTLRARSGSPLELFAGESTLLRAVTYLEDVAYAFPLEPVSSRDVDKTSVQVIEFDRSPDLMYGVSVVASMRPAPRGFSPHLHELPIADSDQKYLVSIAENITEHGLSMGWMVSLWDATDASKLVLINHQSLQAPTTLTDWKPQTFRLTPSGQLVLPMTVEYIGGAASAETRPTDMTGFVVLNVSASEIEEHARVVHVDAVSSISECTARDGECPLDARSFWLSPSILTVGGSSVQLTGIDTDGQSGVTEWSLGLSSFHNKM
ncbi:expressed unknown protein [Seminavis robusta]|uniref:Uncharacterized protein n=1 Tax=Seminavis robusta TaxID=568900 RepID=A0A9N8HU90_9STRA|nr:expressed unknown protein [Seminavis robusta]|eukprot:Sro1625_g286730.1 n/a (1205) ;mRNA; f:3133-6747